VLLALISVLLINRRQSLWHGAAQPELLG
jgi:hypothetical protein